MWLHFFETFFFYPIYNWPTLVLEDNFFDSMYRINTAQPKEVDEFDEKMGREGLVCENIFLLAVGFAAIKLFDWNDVCCCLFCGITDE